MKRLLNFFKNNLPSIVMLSFLALMLYISFKTPQPVVKRTVIGNCRQIEDFKEYHNDLWQCDYTETTCYFFNGNISCVPRVR